MLCVFRDNYPDASDERTADVIDINARAVMTRVRQRMSTTGVRSVGVSPISPRLGFTQGYCGGHQCTGDQRYGHSKYGENLRKPCTLTKLW